MRRAPRGREQARRPRAAREMHLSQATSSQLSAEPLCGSSTLRSCFARARRLEARAHVRGLERRGCAAKRLWSGSRRTLDGAVHDEVVPRHDGVLELMSSSRWTSGQGRGAELHAARATSRTAAQIHTTEAAYDLDERVLVPLERRVVGARRCDARKLRAPAGKVSASALELAIDVARREQSVVTDAHEARR